MTRFIARTLVVATVALGVGVPTGVASAASPASTTDAATEATEASPAAMPTFRFGCRLHRDDGHPIVRCRWSPIQNRRVAGYVVYRAQVRPEHLGRQAIARVRAGDRPVVADRDLTPGSVWVYAVVAVGHSGEPLAVSNLARVVIPPAH